MRVLGRPFAQSLCLALLLVLLVPAVPAQEPITATATDINRALDLYRSGNISQAIEKLTAITRKRPDDPEAWNILAAVLEREGMIVQARPALERLVKLRPNAADVHARLAYALIQVNECARAISVAERAVELGDQSPEAHYAIAEGSLRAGAFAKALAKAEVALTIKPDFLPAWITKSLAHSALQQYPEAALSVERLLAINPNDIDAETWRGQLEELSLRATESQSSPSIGGSPIFTGKEVTEKVRVLSKPEPQFTEPARQAGVNGTVVLRAAFTADGEVKRVFVMRALGYGLTTQAVKAARLIKFNPAIKDGQPVSVFIQLEYNFNVY